MNKNEIFRKFLEDPLIKEKTNLTDDQIMKIDLHKPSPNRLIDVIKTTLLHLEDDQTVDSIVRRINQSFKKEML